MYGETMKAVTDFIFLGSKITPAGDCSHEIKRRLFFGRKAMTNLDSSLKSRNITLLAQVHIQSYGFSSSHVQMWTLDHKEVWVWKNWCFWTLVLEKTPESPLECKEAKPVNPKGNQSWIFIGRTDAEAEAPVLWPPDVKRPDAGKDWGQEKGATEDEMVGWNHWLNGHEFELTLGDNESQEVWHAAAHGGRKDSDTIKRLNTLGFIKGSQVHSLSTDGPRNTGISKGSTRNKIWDLK